MASGGSWKLFDNCLIEAVRKKPVLYNKKLKEFKQINVKDNAWSEVAKEVGANGMFNINKYQCQLPPANTTHYRRDSVSYCISTMF